LFFSRRFVFFIYRGAGVGWWHVVILVIRIMLQWWHVVVLIIDHVRGQLYVPVHVHSIISMYRVYARKGSDIMRNRISMKARQGPVIMY
jgi:hypothetical protein